jgi:hypothetical protein
MSDHAALVRRALDPATATEFDRRVRQQADRLVAAIEAGTFDNQAPTLGLELEAYAVDENCQLARLPEDVFDGPATKELGLHNAELNADPTRFDADGIEQQAAALNDALEATRERARERGLELVLDAMWTVPPADGGHAYLDAIEIHRNEDNAERGLDATAQPDRPVVVPGPEPSDPVIVARNMRRDPRYGALDNEALRRSGGSIELDVPGATVSFRSILFESLTTSVQPHVQVPDVAAVPRYHNLAVRTLGPLLALSTNSPFLPADCYDASADPRAVVAETNHELRIDVFEQSMNRGCRKVGVPADLERPSDVVEVVAADETFGPFLQEWLSEGAGDAGTGDGDGDGDGEGESLDRPTDEGRVDLDSSWEFDYKRGSFWRWVRGVVGGTAVDGACDEHSIRLEYRPIPTQPTVRDNVGMQVLTAGLLVGLVAEEHPLGELSWAAAERSFYAAVADGPNADLAWVTAEGARTDDPDRVFAEVFEYARRGLAERGIPEPVREKYLGPIETRWEHSLTPSVWKQRRVREALDDGASFDGALAEMQREYRRLSRDCETFTEWVAET